jgi:hypothetical protein
MAHGNKDVLQSAVEIVPENPSRIALLLFHNGSDGTSTQIFLGTDSTVTTSNGYPFNQNNPMAFDFAGSADALPLFYRGAFWGIATADTHDIRFLELLPNTE